VTVASRAHAAYILLVDSVQGLHRSTPSELKSRLEAERRGFPFLLFRDGEGRQRILDLDAGRALVRLGRQPGSDVALEWDDQVSRAHAELERIGDAWTLVDDGSRNGSFVNGDRVVRRRVLRSGDVVRVGHTLLTYVAPGDTPANSTAVAATDIAPAVTAAQRRVLVALCRPFATGRFAIAPSNAALAQELNISVDTVKFHLHALFEAFSLAAVPQHQKRAALARLALERGAVSERELRDETAG
jgi:pSer/pThr/pTyr-binding forkhead associated (FHA) protein